MNQESNTAVADNQPSETTSSGPSWSDPAWRRVKTAITTRWPHLDERDVEALPCDVFQLERFLGEYTETSTEEIESVVREHAPSPSIMQRASHLGEQVGEQLAPPVRSAIERVRYEVDEHRATATGLVFVSGIALGALATALYFRSRPQPSMLQSYLPDRWRS